MTDTYQFLLSLWICDERFSKKLKATGEEPRRDLMNRTVRVRDSAETPVGATFQFPGLKD